MSSRGRKKTVWAASILVVAVGLVLWGFLERGPEVRSPAPSPTPASSPLSTAPLDAQEGWVERLAKDPDRLLAITSPAMKALRSGRPWDAVRLSGPTSAHAIDGAINLRTIARAVSLRARVELALALWQAREVALLVQRDYLEARLKDPPSQAGREIFPFLRAALALQAGEAIDIDPLLAQVPMDGVLGPARAFLLEVAKQPLEETASLPFQAGLRWMRNVRGYQRALSGLDCPLPGRAPERLALLADWVEQGGVPRETPIGDVLVAGAPDFDFGACEPGAGIKVDLYDPTLYTVLSVLMTEDILDAPESGALARFFQIQLERRVMPDAAKRHACELLQAWPSGFDPEEEEAFLVYGDWSDTREMFEVLEAFCRGTEAACPLSSDGSRDILEGLMKKFASRSRRIEESDPVAGNLVAGLHLFGGMIRRPYLEPFLSGKCPDRISLADDTLRLWRGMVEPGSRWESAEASLAWARIDAELRRYEDGVKELAQLARQEPLFAPLFHMARRASAYGKAAGEFDGD